LLRTLAGAARKGNVARPRSAAQLNSPKVLDKALGVLEAFDDAHASWSETELRDWLAIPSSTLNRILRGLEHAGYLLRDDGGRYRLGISAVMLGRRADASLNLAAVLDRQLRALGEQTEELVLLAVPELSTGVARYIGTVDSPQRLRVTAAVGSAVPLTAGATARTLLAFAPAAQIDQVLARPRERLAAGTIMSARDLRAALRQITRRGWALSFEETYEGAWAAAAPVRGADGRAFASIGVAAPLSRHSARRESSTHRAVVAAARAATARLAVTDGAGRPVPPRSPLKR
jgi:DNA-binding IclR family transcriptional regulator